MNNILSKFKITRSLNSSFMIIILAIILMVGFFQWSTSRFNDIFTDYRAQARFSLLLANLTEDFIEARIAVLKYRESADPKQAELVKYNIEEISELGVLAAEVVRDSIYLKKLENLRMKTEEYAAIFERARVLQNSAQESIDKIDVLGPNLRASITSSIDSSYGKKDMYSALYASRLQENFMLARYYTKSFLVKNQKSDLDRAIKELKSATKSASLIQNKIQDSLEKSRFQKSFAGISQYKAHLLEIGKIVSKRNDLYFNGLDKLGPEILDSYDELFESVEREQNRLGPIAVSTLESTSKISIAFGLSVLFFVFALSFVVVRYITESFNLIVNQTNRLAKGDKKFTILGTNYANEVGAVSNALKVFQQNMIDKDNSDKAEKIRSEKAAADKKEMEEQARLTKIAEQEKKKAEVEEREAQEAEKRAKLEEERQIAKAQGIRESVEKFEKIIDEIMDALTQSSSSLNNLSFDLTDAMNGMTQKSASVATISNETSVNVSSIAAATEEMSASFQNISKEIQDTSLTAKNCSDAARKTQISLNELQVAVNEIDNVIKSIGGVAEQTNLLALNATIEASRAGEAGKGFAVVASEVKALASETQSMTEEINKKVDSIKLTSQSTINSVSEIIDKVSSVDSKTSHVSLAVEEQNETNLEISKNILVAANGTSQVTENINLVLSAAESSSAMTGTLNAASEDLNKQAKVIKTSLDNFLREVESA
ncbi:MAG: methyl-accepting chemotaxis protein [Bdellovibrionales bacterium]